MKSLQKIVSLALFLSLVLAVPAFAESVEAIQIDWSDALEQSFVDAGYSGTWYTLNDLGCQLIIPEGHVQQELSEEDIANEYVYWFSNEEIGGSIEVFDSYIEGCPDLLHLGSSLQNQYPDRLLQYAYINGAAAIINGVEEYDIVNVIFDLGDSRFAQIMFSPMSKANSLLTACIASIQFNLDE